MPGVPEQERLVGQTDGTAPSVGHIRAELEKILSSPAFDATVRMRKFLAFVVEMAVSGRADELKAYTIATEVYGRSAEFNPAEDTVVRIQAGRLRRALDMYYLTDGKSDPVRINIPKGTYVPCFAYGSEPVPTPLEPGISFPGEAGPLIAVLPFANLTGDPQNNYFAAGFTEEVAIELTHYEDFYVIGCRPAFGAEGNMAHVEANLKDLGVRFLIEGSIRKVNQLMRIGIKLTDAKTGVHLWAEQYQQDLTAGNMLRLQEDISREVVARIAGEFGIIPTRLSVESRKKAPKELSTYEAMLRCYYFHAVLSQEAFRDAFASLQVAVEKEPDCAMTLAMLGDLYLTSYSLDFRGIEHPVERGAELIERAVLADPMNQFVQLALAHLHFVKEDRRSFLEASERVVSLNPNSGLRTGAAGFFLCLFGEWERGMVPLERSMRLNPTFPNWFYGPIVLHHYRRRDYRKAYEEAVKYSMPNNFWGPMLRVAALGQLDRVEEAAADLSALQVLRPDFMERAGDLIRRYVKEEGLVQQIIEGLTKAGVRLSLGAGARTGA